LLIWYLRNFVFSGKLRQKKVDHKHYSFWGFNILWKKHFLDDFFSGAVFVLSGLKLIHRQNVEVKNAIGKKVD
jgi:hypothetical protein